MKATELRLGNLIKIGGNTLETYQTYTPTKVTLAILNEIAGENKERPDAELSVFQPILLDGKWFRKFGFVKDGKYFCKGAHCNFFTGLMKFKYDKFLEIWQFDIGIFEDLTRIQYVHQLQNLYFALTGEELNK